MERLFGAIQSLLAEEGCDLSAALMEGRAIMTNNLGSLRTEDIRGYGDADRGFHLIICDREGTPMHLVKCRPAAEGSPSPIEGAAYHLFREDPRSAALIPRANSLTRDGFHLQYLEFQAGLRGDRFLANLTVAQLHELSERVMDAADVLAGVYMGSSESLPQEPPSPRLALADVFESAIEAGLLTSSQATRLTRDAEVAELSPVPQHRDLWPKNLIVDDSGQIRIIDFDSYGSTTVPLLDACHWARTCSLQYWPDACRSGWLAAILEAPAVRRLAAVVLRRAATDVRLSERLWMPLILCYMVDITVHTMRRGGPEEFWAPLKEELRASLALYEGGARVEW